MPDFPIVDTHVHLWKPGGAVGYSWLAGEDRLNRPFLLADHAEASAGLDIEAMVFLECDVDPGGELAEAEWVAGLAETEPRLKAIVAKAPLERGEAVRADLEKLAEIPLLRGIRRIYQSEPDHDFPLRPGFVAGVRTLADFGLSFDICINWRYMDATIRFAEQVPEVSMVLDHIGKPDIRGGNIEPWASQMKRLAALDHVSCKLSGVATEANHDNWTREELRPYILAALDAFGPERCMFGGDWPVATLAIGYRQWVDVLDEALDELTDTERRAVFAETAKRFYRL